MEDRAEEININADCFGDSYARDTSVEELKEVSTAKHPIGLRESYFSNKEKTRFFSKWELSSRKRLLYSMHPHRKESRLGSKKRSIQGIQHLAGGFSVVYRSSSRQSIRQMERMME